MLKRFYSHLEKYLKPNKALIIYGARQVGKTTILEQFLEECGLRFRLDSGDNIRIQNLLSSEDFDQIIEYASAYELIAIDEAQKVPNNLSFGFFSLIYRIFWTSCEFFLLINSLWLLIRRKNRNLNQNLSV